MMSEEKKPIVCPYCKAEPAIQGITLFWVQCTQSNHECCGPCRDTKQKAVEAWDAREVG